MPWKATCPEIIPLAPGKHFKPLQRYNACGTGTFWQFGNRYTGTVSRSEKVLVTLAAQRL
jgi:hypothetical protein